MRRALFATTLALLGAGCGGGSSPPPAPADLATPIAGATAWLDRPDLEIASSLVMAGLQPMYSLALTVDPAAIFEQHVADLQTAGQTDAAGSLSLFRRLYNNTVTFDAYYLSQAGVVDQMTLKALYCDTEPVPAGFRDDLMAASLVGGYDTTHVLLAALILRSLGCNDVLSAIDKLNIELRTAALINLGDGLLDDLDIEAMTFLAEAGRMDLVPEAARQALLATQQPDGSWAEHNVLPDGSPLPVAGFQHATALALSFLLAWQADGVFIPLVPPAP